MANYTSQTIIQQYLNRSLSANEIAFLTTLLPAVDSWINNYIGNTSFGAGASTRRYDGGLPCLRIDPATEVTAVELLDMYGNVVYTYAYPGDYELEPLNETVKTEIRFRSTINYDEYSEYEGQAAGRPPKGIGNVRVSAKFQGDSVPADVQLAATRLAAIIMASSTNLEGLKSEEIEGHKLVYNTSETVKDLDDVAASDPTIKALLSPYREILI